MSKAKGTRAEAEVVAELRARGWMAWRLLPTTNDRGDDVVGSGVADVVALKAGSRPRLIEVKATTRGPFAGFTPARRERMLEVAEAADADAILAWKQPYQGIRYLPPAAWPQ
jgi:Holliday junction resolvase